MMNRNGCYFCKCNCQNFHVLFTFYTAHIILYWPVAISNDVSYLRQMVQTRAAEDAALDIPEGSAERGRGRGQASHANPPAPL
jgi:hypothetical protein